MKLVLNETLINCIFYWITSFLLLFKKPSYVTIIDQAWRERDAALLRDQMSQTQMNSMREKLESVESAVKSVSKNTRDE